MGDDWDPRGPFGEVVLCYVSGQDPRHLPGRGLQALAQLKHHGDSLQRNHETAFQGTWDNPVRGPWPLQAPTERGCGPRVRHCAISHFSPGAPQARVVLTRP